MGHTAILKKFRSKKILTIENLMMLLGRSIRTARRFAKEHQLITSINKNARFYTLPDIPTFDSNGMWQYKKIYFSQYGNLREAVLHLIFDAEGGLTVGEIVRMAGLADNSSFISTFKDVEIVRREEIGNCRYVYYAGDPVIYQRQKKWRLSMTERMASLPSDADAVAILVELIRHPDRSSDELAKSLLNKGKQIKREAIKRLLVHHDIKKKAE